MITVITPFQLFQYGLAVAGSLLFIGIVALGIVLTFLAMVSPSTVSSDTDGKPVTGRGDDQE